MLTVLLATRNRATILKNTLEAFCHLQSLASGWKLVVVDNGSTDQTLEVLGSFTERLPVVAIRESKLGKNFALNAGLALVEGDLTILTDDDIFPAPNWLIELRKVADSQPKYSIFGGTIVPHWEISPPHWVEWIADPGPVFTLTDSSQKEGEIAPYLVFGPNMAIRTSIFQSGIRFDSSIGPSGTDYAMGSETELILRLARMGHKAWFAQNAVVEHLIRQDQLTEAWVMRRAVRWGRGRYRMAQNPKLWFGTPRHLFRDIPRETISLVAASMCLNRKAVFQSRWRLNVLRGMAQEAREMRQDHNKTSASAITANQA